MSIMETAMWADYVIKNSPEVNKKTVNHWLFFDDNNKPYIAFVKKDGKKRDVFSAFYEIFVYPLKDNKKTILENEKVAELEMYYSKYGNPNKEVTLKNIEIYDKQYLNVNNSRKGIGSNLITILETIVNNVDMEHIEGMFVPHGIAREKENMVKKFYKKNGYNVVPSKYGEDHVEEIHKTLNIEDVYYNKLKVINYPQLNNNITCIIPVGKIMAGDYLGSPTMESK